MYLPIVLGKINAVFIKLLMLSLTSVIVMLQYIYSFIDMLAVLLYEQQYCTQRPYFVSAINGKPLMLTIPDFISNFLGDVHVFHYLRLRMRSRRLVEETRSVCNGPWFQVLQNQFTSTCTCTCIFKFRFTNPATSTTSQTYYLLSRPTL